MCYEYYREKDAAEREGDITRMDITRQTVNVDAKLGASVAKQAEEKAAARFLKRIRQLVAGQDQKREEVA